MKKIQLASLIILVFAISLRGQVNETIFQTLDSTIILQSLFDASSPNENGWVTWKPNFPEKINFPVSKDGSCYTKMDTILYLNNDWQQIALIVFETFPVEDGRRTKGSLISTAVFNKLSTATTWQVNCFNKKLYYDPKSTTGNFELVKLNAMPNWGYALAFTSEYTTNKIIFRTIQYYDFYYSKELFSSFVFTSNKEDTDKAKHFGYTAQVKIIPSTDWSIFEINYKGTDKDYKTNKIYSVDGSRKFYYDTYARVYVKKRYN